MALKPKVSVIIPTYKRPLFLRRAIQSVLNQTYENIELIVVDDNNSDDDFRKETESLMNELKDKRIRYIKHKRNKNGSAARNTGIRLATGKYITFLDDDDEFLPEKIEKQVQCMEQLDESWVGCYTLIKRYVNGKLIDKSIDSKSGDIYLDVFKNELFFNSGSNLLVRRSTAIDINGFDESFKRIQDLEFLIRIAEKGKIASIDTCLLKVHLEDRQNSVPSSKYIECVNHFFMSFEDKLNTLPSNEKKKVYISKNLEILKLYIYEKKIIDAINHIARNRISPIILIKYIIYLVNRRLRKLCYGFKF